MHKKLEKLAGASQSYCNSNEYMLVYCNSNVLNDITPF